MKKIFILTGEPSGDKLASTVVTKLQQDHLDIGWLNKQTVMAVTKHTKWIQLDRPVTVTIDGQTGEGTIIKPLDLVQEAMDEHEASGI